MRKPIRTEQGADTSGGGMLLMEDYEHRIRLMFGNFDAIHGLKIGIWDSPVKIWGKQADCQFHLAHGLS